jgi:hypothetical protein
MKPTKKQIKQEVAKLKDLAPNIRQHSAFGDDNRAQIEAQIDVLEHDLYNDDIFETYDHSGVGEEILDAALSARDWLDGYGETKTLSEDWEGLDQRN